MRQDIYEMFIHYGAEFQYKWNKIIARGFDSFAEQLDKYANRAYVEGTSCDA